MAQIGQKLTLWLLVKIECIERNFDKNFASITHFVHLDVGRCWP